MTKKEEHEPGNLGYCKKCGHSIWNREPCPNTMKAPQQQSEEEHPHRAGTVHHYLCDRLNCERYKPHPQQTEEKKHAWKDSNNPYKLCDVCGSSFDDPIHAPQQTEQWMEELNSILKTRVSTVASNNGCDYYEPDVCPACEKYRLKLTKLITTQIEAAKREERELIKSILESMITETKKYWNEKAPDNCLLCWGDGYCTHKIEREKLQELFASLTNHN